MFILAFSLFLFVGQNPNYTYFSENVQFKESPAFVFRVEEPSYTVKTKIEVKAKEVKGRISPFRIDPREARPISIPLNLKDESISQQVQVKNIPPIKIENTEKKTSEVVFFEFDSYVLRPSEKVKLDSLSRDIQYRVTGFTCDIGGKKYNDELALKRAEAVRNYLGDIVKEVGGKGKCCYLDPVDKSKNRRAEIKPLNKIN